MTEALSNIAEPLVMATLEIKITVKRGAGLHVPMKLICESSSVAKFTLAISLSDS